jgi:hypothetical protein
VIERTARTERHADEMTRTTARGKLDRWQGKTARTQR